MIFKNRHFLIQVSAALFQFLLLILSVSRGYIGVSVLLGILVVIPVVCAIIIYQVEKYHERLNRSI